MIAFTSISQGCMWRCYGRKNGASWWWPQLSSWSQMFSICQNFLLDKKWWIQDQLDSEDNTCGPVLLYPCTDALFFKSVSSNVSSDLLLQIHQQGGGRVFSQATLRDLANCSREVSSSNQLSATFLEMHLLQMSKDLNSWDLTASPGYWPLITSWWKFKMLSSPINFHCFTGSEKSVDSHLSMSIGECQRSNLSSNLLRLERRRKRGRQNSPVAYYASRTRNSFKVE